MFVSNSKEKGVQKKLEKVDDSKTKKYERPSNWGDNSSSGDEDEVDEEKPLPRERRASKFITDSSSSSKEESSSRQSSDVSGKDDGKTRMTYRLHVKTVYGTVKCDHRVLKKFIRYQVGGAGNIKNLTDAKNSAIHVSRFVQFFDKKAEKTNPKKKIVKVVRRPTPIYRSMSLHSEYELHLTTSTCFTEVKYQRELG